MISVLNYILAIFFLHGGHIYRIQGAGRDRPLITV